MNIKKIHKILRTHDWWNYIVPPILAYYCLSVHLSDITFYRALELFLILMISVTGTAIFGFFLNDWTDIAVDRKSGKPNYSENLSLATKWMILVFSFGLGVVPWVLISANHIVYFLLSAQVILLIAYSMKPIRLKRWYPVALLTDSIYSGLLFILICLFMIHPPIYNFHAIIVVTGSALFCKGLRNIILHQAEDIEFDRSAGHKTFATIFSVNKIKITCSIILILELTLFSLSILIISFMTKWILVILPVIAIFVILKLPKNRTQQDKGHYEHLRFWNDIYEDFLPITTIGLCVTNDARYLVFLGVFYILFFKKINKNKLFQFIWYKIIVYIFYHYLYHRILVWLYYKMFCNPYIKRAYRLIGLKTNHGK